jgi:hypothetical protein
MTTSEFVHPHATVWFLQISVNWNLTETGKLVPVSQGNAVTSDIETRIPK